MKIRIGRAVSLLCIILVVIIRSSAFASESTEIYKAASPAVVLILGGNKDSSPWKKGAGSVIKKGYVLTNAHVVLAENGKPFDFIYVYFRPQGDISANLGENLKEKRTAKVVKYSESLDLALLSVENPPDVHPIPLGESGKVAVGEEVLAIGHPEQGGVWTLTSGKIGAILKDLEGVKGKDVFQTDASINRGNSGGPLLNYYGQLIGINTSKAKEAPDGTTIVGISFSLQARVANNWLKGSDADVQIQPIDKSVVPNREKSIVLPRAKNGDVEKILTPARPFEDADLVSIVKKTFDKKQMLENSDKKKKLDKILEEFESE